MMVDCSRQVCKRRPWARPFLLSLLLAGVLGATGCGLLASSPGDERIAIRTPKPTFTPTPTDAPTAVDEAAQAPPGQPVDAAGSALTAPVANSGAKAVVNGPLVNIRSGPSTDFDVLIMAERGAEYDIVGVNPERTWWQVCCIDGAEGWIIAEYVDTLGAVDSVAVVGGTPTAAATPVPAPDQAAAPVTPTTPPQPAVNFTLQTQEQFPETSHVRIFLYVYSGQSALDGYSLRVTKDGESLPVDGESFGGQPAFTWPFADARQRFQNFKVEFPNVETAGQWVLQLVDSNGTPVGPPATFILSKDDPQQELYVRYEQQ